MSSVKESLKKEIEDENRRGLVRRWLLAKESMEDAMDVFGMKRHVAEELAKMTLEDIDRLAASGKPLTQFTIDERMIKLSMAAKTSKELCRFLTLVPGHA